MGRLNQTLHGTVTLSPSETFLDLDDLRTTAFQLPKLVSQNASPLTRGVTYDIHANADLDIVANAGAR